MAAHNRFDYLSGYFLGQNMNYGILKSLTNTGKDDELSTVFVAPLSIVSNQPAYVQDTLNLRRVASYQNVQRWEIAAGLAPSVGDPTTLLMTTKFGHNGILSVRMPQVAKLQCSGNGITTVGALQAGQDTLAVTGASKMVAGEFINIGNDPKVYLVAEAGNLGFGVKIHPPLRQPAPSGSVIKTNGSVTMKARLDNTTAIGITYTDGILSDPGQLTFIEAL